MEYTEILKEAIATLIVNKLRTGLAALGIVIGIASVIVLISLGANLLTVNPAAQRTGAVRGAAGGGTTLTLEDVNAIKTSPHTTIANVSPEISRRVQVTTGKSNTNVQGVTKVAVVGPQVVTDLFGDGAAPVGESIRIGGLTFTIIGITASKGGTGFANQDDLIWVPLSTAQKQLFGVDYLSSIAMEAKSPEVMTDAQNEVGYLLLNRHKLTDPTQADFSIFSQADILNTVSSTTGTFTALLSGIAAISLLVGGILGMVLGIAISYIISTLIHTPFVVSLFAILLATVVSAGIGILFGAYPARRAANLQPIEALRYE